ncbi:hypothetical protein R5R35_005692 [Gryllus longicercus]|uniref:Uncharacterized protein n=1 Tax=Gryllus longicercus TaxID=2509291 RepID=A0AAN9Z8W4_9ORTH
MHVVGGSDAPPADHQGPDSSSSSNHVTSSSADSVSNLPPLDPRGQQLDSNGNGTPAPGPNGESSQGQLAQMDQPANGNGSNNEENANGLSTGASCTRLSLSADRTRRIRSEWLADAGPSHLKVLNRCSGPTGKQSFRLQWHITQDVSESDWIALCYTGEFILQSLL